MDGRPDDDTTKFLKELFGVEKIDKITGPGADGLFLKGGDAAFKGWISGEVEKLGGDVTPETIHQILVDWAKFMVVNVSIQGHGSRNVAVVGHGNHCAGNPVENEQHLKDVNDTVELVRSWIPEDLRNEVNVVGIFADANQEGGWSVEKL